MGVFRQFPYSNFHEMNMDEIIKIVKNMLEEWAQYYTTWDNWKEQVTQEWAEMQDFINNYFDNLDVQNEINNKITNMVASGEFDAIVSPYIPPSVSDWLAAHITQPVGVVIDTSLSVSGACADAKATGDPITNLETNLGLFRLVWTRGGIDSTTGANVNSTIQLRTNEYYELYNKSGLALMMPANLRLYALWYDSSMAYLGRNILDGANSGYSMKYLELYTNAKYVRFMYSRWNDDTSRVINVSDVENTSAFNLPDNGLFGALTVTNCGYLPSNLDIDNVTYSSIYYVQSSYSSIPSRFAAPAYLITIKTGEKFPIQMWITTQYIAYRRYANNAWLPWNVLGYMGLMPTGTSFDTENLNGTAYKASNAHILNSPQSGIGIIETMGDPNPTGFKFIRYTSSDGNVYIRRRTFTGRWLNWIRINPVPVLATLDTDAAVYITKNVKPIQSKWETSANTMPIASNAISGSWETYEANEEVIGLPYSSASLCDGIILYNRQLDTFLSATENPHSVLYTKRAGVPDMQSGIKAGYYGTACSALASAVLGLPIMLNTAGLRHIGTEVAISNYTDIHPGDLLLNITETDTNHTIIVKSVQMNIDGDVNINCIESVAPETRNRVFTEEAITDLLENGYKIYRYPNAEYPPVTIHPYATDIIPEYGCNTWYHLDVSNYDISNILDLDAADISSDQQKIRIYVTEVAGNKLYYKLKSALTWNEVAFNLDSNNVMDITSYINTAGIWQLSSYPDADRGDMPICEISVVDVGTVTTDAAGWTFSDMGNCTPLWYDVFGSSGDTEDGSRITGMIENNFLPFPTTTWTYVRVYYDTGYGQFHINLYP